jgi:dTDP-4-dehydrorhamnose reductase
VRALVTGSAGQLGLELLRTSPPDFQVIGLSHGDCDITDREQVEAAVQTHRPELIINAAAYTAVDAAETASEVAYAVNAAGAGNVARSAANARARIIHISTDYVFDGTNSEPYLPDSVPKPISVYGASKLAGEQEVQRNSPSSLIIRSGWIYSSHGRNFLRTILASIRAAKPLRVVANLTGVPTSARSLAVTIWESASRSEVHGVHHWVDDGTASWYDFAVAIQEIAVEQGLVDKPVPIAAITSEEYGAPARRPPYSVLDSGSLSRAIALKPRPWRTRVAETLREVDRAR